MENHGSLVLIVTAFWAVLMGLLLPCHEYGQSGLIRTRHRKSSLHLRTEPTLTLPQQHSTCLCLAHQDDGGREASSPSLPHQFLGRSGGGVRDPQGASLAPRQLLWITGRLGGYIYIQAAVIPYKVEGKARKEENDLLIKF